MEVSVAAAMVEERVFMVVSEKGGKRLEAYGTISLEVFDDQLGQIVQQVGALTLDDGSNSTAQLDNRIGLHGCFGAEKRDVVNGVIGTLKETLEVAFDFGADGEGLFN